MHRLLLVMVTACAGGHAAATQSTMASCANTGTDKITRPLPGALAKMEYFVGRWHCDGKAEKSHLWPEHPTSSTMTIEHDLNNFWLSLRVQEAESPVNTAPLRTSGWWGYEEHSGQLFRIFATNFGGWGNGSAQGWQGDVLTWLGTINQGNGDHLEFRHEITRESENVFHEQFSVRSGADAEWVVRGGSRCTRL